MEARPGSLAQEEPPRTRRLSLGHHIVARAQPGLIRVTAADGRTMR